MEVLGIIPARGGSKGIPRKNLKLLGGIPLIEHTIQASKGVKSLSRVIISTDDDEIAHVGRRLGVEVPFLRPAEFASDRALMIDVVHHALNYFSGKENYRPDVIILLQPTSPLRKSKHIHDALEIFFSKEPDTVVSVTKVPHHFLPDSLYKLESGYLVPLTEGKGIFDRHLKPTYYSRNGPAILIASTHTILEKRTFYGEKVIPYEMEEQDSIDIDNQYQFELAEYLLRNQNSL